MDNRPAGSSHAELLTQAPPQELSREKRTPALETAERARVTHQFVFPSTYDGILLEGRIYEPHASVLQGHKAHTIIGAIVAHPYAPLGGSYDDPVVGMIVAKVLEYGFAGTFNFRRGMLSRGGTSLSATQEAHDYSSFLSLFTEYLEHRLEAILGSRSSIAMPRTIRVIHAGYSYGSMIASRVRPWRYNNWVRACPFRDEKASERSEVQKKLDGIVHYLVGPHEPPLPQITDTAEIFTRSRCFNLETYYLLVSPLLPPVTTLLAPLTMKSWWPLSGEDPTHLHEHATLAIYGTGDTFTSISKLNRWAENLRGKSLSRFTFVAVSDAGHFWREPEACFALQQAIGDWIRTTVSA